MTITDKRLQELADRDESLIDYSDIPELGDEFWKNAKLVWPTERKEQLTVRFDADVVSWFRAHGKGYQTHMNAVLRAYVDAEKK